MRFLLWLTAAAACTSFVGCGTEDDPVSDNSDDDTSDDTSDDTRDDDGKDTAKRDSGMRDASPGKVDASSVKRDAGTPDDNQPPRGDAGRSTPDSGTPDAPAAVPAGPHTAAGFKNLAPTLGAALDPKGSTLSPAPPSGWVWHAIDGAICRDGSPTGFYTHIVDSSDSLLFYLEGGGACTSPDFCAYNPKNVNEKLAGDGQTLIGSVGGATPGRQQPGTDGIFAFGNAANPFKTWNQIYVPYCTGDVHAGTKTNVKVPGVDGNQQFVGYRNMEKFLARIVPTFQAKVKRVVLTGASAGGFGTMLNFSLVQDSFGDGTWVTALNDSGPSFADEQLPVCMQKRWRELWGFAGSLPTDCTECQQANGGGLGKVAKFLERKHPNFRVGLVSSTHDEVIRAFYAMGLDNCSGFDTASPVPAVLISFPSDQYEAGLVGIRSTYMSGGRFASYYINGFLNNTYHQHIWRPRFYEAAQGGSTIAQWTTDFLAGKMNQVGP
ncbi:MAG TPA: pectin acetylesterase-family hydrolase [Polyangiales bacterium]|nr:pectin acetylesterase-family hydrolase [Polyangiales bacterium]